MIRKALIFAMSFFAVSVVSADTFTTRFNLCKPSLNSPTWGPKEWSNWDIEDGNMAGLGIPNVFSSTETFLGPVSFSQVVTASTTYSINSLTAEFAGYAIGAGTVPASGVNAGTLGNGVLISTFPSGLSISAANLSAATMTLNGPVNAPTAGTYGQVLTSSGTGNPPFWNTPSAGGASFWTAAPGTPTMLGASSFTVTGNYTSLFNKKVVVKWTESSVVREAMVSIPAAYTATVTTVTIVGDAMASIDAASLSYALIEAKTVNFAVAGSIGVTGTDMMNDWYADEPYRVFGADVYTGTAGTTNNTTFDIKDNTVTMFTTKPTLATTVAASPAPFTADSHTSMALNDRISVDITAVQTTPAAVDAYVKLYVFPTKY